MTVIISGAVDPAGLALSAALRVLARRRTSGTLSACSYNLDGVVVGSRVYAYSRVATVFPAVFCKRPL